MPDSASNDRATNPLVDYATFAAWLLPSFGMWLFGELIIRPKTDEMMPPDMSPILNLAPINNFLFFNFWFIVFFLVALTVILEVLCKPWRRGGRRIALPILAWVFHVYVLVSTALVAAFALIAVESAQRS